MLIIGIGGGTGSGKTTVAQAIVRQLDNENVKIIAQDSYYLNLSDLPMDERSERNFDHPDAFDTALLREHLQKLKAGLAIEKPVYSFREHARSALTETVSNCNVAIAEGILVLHDPEIRASMDIKIYVDTPDDIRFIRRLQRDITERGRTVGSVIRQYFSTVRPMHLEFVEPTKRYADIIVPEGGYNPVAIDLIVSKIRRILA